MRWTVRSRRCTVSDHLVNTFLLVFVAISRMRPDEPRAAAAFIHSNRYCTLFVRLTAYQTRKFTPNRLSHPTWPSLTARCSNRPSYKVAAIPLYILQRAWRRAEQLHRRSGVPSRLSREGKRELTESSREFPKASIRLSPKGSLQEVRTRLATYCFLTAGRSNRLSRKAAAREVAQRTPFVR